jgi:hypothetical protein
MLRKASQGSNSELLKLLFLTRAGEGLFELTGGVEGREESVEVCEASEHRHQTDAGDEWK